uniref:Uncharacterized protein LOC105036970 n=1 Tax=Elaeis guineensis var. tenera TaxID=51953 RepID=A0A6I9QNE5_ELAGV|nr:uncharacterized protein LOC105036970 [Elaeis guineensis]
MGKGAKRKNQSICDKFALMAVKLVKDSSFVIAKMTLGSPSGRIARDAPIEASPSLPREPTTPMLRVERVSHFQDYVAEPDDGDSIDRQAADYIREVKQKLISQSDPDAVADVFNSIPPPPPPPTPAPAPAPASQ